MQSTELQLNDLVMVGNQVVKVTSLGEYTINGQPATMFHPIPLTTEVLEASGFYLGRTSQEEDLASAIGIHLRGEKWCIDDGDVEVTVSFPNESDGGMVTVDNLKDKYMQFLFEETIYVHEFQHGLRQCDLKVLAATLKLRKL